MQTRTLFLLITVCAATALGAARTASVSGNWKSTAVWGGTVPGDGDTITIANGITVTVNDSRTVGTSGENGTLAIDLGASGKLVISNGGELRVRGDVRYTAGTANTSDAVVVQAGGRWRWDSSAAAAPPTTQYKFYPSTTYGFRLFKACGDSAGTCSLTGAPGAAPAMVDSDPGGGPGYFSLNGGLGGGGFVARYAEFSRIGDAKTPGWYLSFYNAPAYPTSVLWDVTNSTFLGCGATQTIYQMAPTGVFRHNFNYHEDSRAQGALQTDSMVAAKADTGIRELAHNVFDRRMVTELSRLGGATIYGNYIGDKLMHTSATNAPWLYFENNFHRASVTDVAMAGGDVTNSYIFTDIDAGNPHVLSSYQSAPITVDGVIWSHGGTSVGDSGEFLMGSFPYTFTNSILLPDMYGYSPGEALAMTAFMASTVTVEHNTFFGGHMKDVTGRPGFGTLQLGENGPIGPNRVSSLQSNIFWNPQLPGKQADFVKVTDLIAVVGTRAKQMYHTTPGTSSSMTIVHGFGSGATYNSRNVDTVEGCRDGSGTVLSVTGSSSTASSITLSYPESNDVTCVVQSAPGYCQGGSVFPGGASAPDQMFLCEPALDMITAGKADYNAGWNFSTNWSALTLRSWFPDPSLGYAVRMSQLPTHDINADPQFRDWKRDVVLFDSKYLGNTYSRWNATATYAKGDLVTWSRGNPENLDTHTPYWGLDVNFRYINQNDLAADLTAETVSGCGTVYKSGTRPFRLGDVGTYFEVLGGDGWTPGVYTITGLCGAGRAKLSGSPAPSGSTGGGFQIGCNGANPEPMAGSNSSGNTGYNGWRNCWEWASLYRLREGIRNQLIFDDQTLGVHGEDVISTLIKWVRAGYSPGNLAYSRAAHDGADIGAVAVTLAPPLFPQQSGTGPTVSVRTGGQFRSSGKVVIQR